MFWENAILVLIRAGVFWKKVRSCLQANLLHVVENDQRYLHLFFTTVSKLLYSLGHVLAAPYEPEDSRKSDPKKINWGWISGRAIHLEAEERSPYEPEDSNINWRGRSAFALQLKT